MLAVIVGLVLFRSAPATAQTSPATLPDLELSTASFLASVAVQEDGKIIIAGDFVSVNDVPRMNIARLNPNGSVDLTWNPKINGVVQAVAANGTNVYLGGSFIAADAPSHMNLVRVSIADGATDANWGPGGIDNAVRKISVVGSNVFVTGYFTYIGGFSRNYIAKLDSNANGAVDQTWHPDPNNYLSALVVNQEEVFVAGEFTSIGGQSRTNLAKLSASGAGMADPIWNPKPVKITGGFGGSLALNGTNLYVSGLFTNISGVARSYLAKLSTLGSGFIDTNWNPNGSFGGSLPFEENLALQENSLFVGDHSRVVKLDANGNGNRDDTWNANFDSFGVSFLRVTQSGLFAVGGLFNRCNDVVSLSIAKLDLVTGVYDSSFNANAQRLGTVSAIAQQSDGKLIIGGDFWFAGGLPRRNLARINQDGSLDRTWIPDANGLITALAVSGSNVFVGGEFTKIGSLNRTNLAKLDTASSDKADPVWDARIDIYRHIQALAVSGSNLFVGGSFDNIGGQTRYGLAKLSTTGIGDADSMWLAPPSGGIILSHQVGLVNALAVDGTNLFVGGVFTKVGGEFETAGGVPRTNLAKLSTLGSGAVDVNWDASIVTDDAFSTSVRALSISETNLFVGGYFSNIGGLHRGGVAKVNAGGVGLVDSSWDPAGTNRMVATALAVGDRGTNLYVYMLPFSGFSPFTNSLLRIGVVTGLIDPFYATNDAIITSGAVSALLPIANDLYVGGNFPQIGGANRSGLAFLTVADAPQLIQDSPTELFMARNAGDGPEVTHFRISGVSGGTLYRSDGVTPVNAGDFITVAVGEAGLKFVPGGTVTAVSALNNTPAGAGTATSSLTMVSNPSPVFKFSAAAYSVREGQGNIVVPVRKFGAGSGTVNYATSDLTATGGQDYQTRSGTLNFSATDRFQNLIITIADDLQPEGDERFAVTLTNASVGASIAGPATAIVTIVDNDIVGVSDSLTTTVSPAAPPVSTGVLAVSLQPTNANGQWRLLGELNWHDSGASVSGLVTGKYGVEFLPVNGYFQPQTVTVPISVSVTNTVTFFYASTTNLESGTLSVIIKPDEVATATNTTLRGQWRRQGGPTNWLDAGELVPHLNAGSYTVEFKPVAGRSTPLPQIVQVGGADAIYSGVGTYFFASSPGAQTPTVVPFNTATSNEPYLYNGQIQTSVGFGSGFVVKPRVVLTTAHVLFDDVQLTNVTRARWFFQRYRDQLEPVPQVPRGWYIFEGYASQRQLDNSPGLSTPASQNLDAAALYFLEDAGRGGYGGYLSSDADNNEYLLSANNKFLVGYPLDGVSLAEQGKLFATIPENLTFTRLYTSIFATTNIQSFPGNSGGPLYVQADVDKYLPAAICLGGSGETLVRAINSEIVDLINRAEISGNGGGNIVGGGVTLLSPGITAPPFGTGLLTVSMTPTNALNVRPGWRYTDTNFITDALATVALIGGGNYPIEFKPVPGFITPSNRTVLIAVGQTVTLQAEYVPVRPLLSFDYTNGLSLSGATGASYKMEYTTNLAMPIAWTPLTTFTLISSPFTLSGTGPATNGSGYYRAVLVP